MEIRGNSTRNPTFFLIGRAERGSGGPSALWRVERGEHYGLVMNAGGMVIDRRGGLGAEVAVTGVEVERADVVGATGAGKLHASLNPFHGVVSSHTLSVVPLPKSGAHGSGAAKVMREG
jgi:hypothetical protein